LTVANQIYLRFKAAGKALNKGDIAVVSGAEFHNYQVWRPLLTLSNTGSLIVATAGVDSGGVWLEDEAGASQANQVSR
jgi:hypothetical protein